MICKESFCKIMNSLRDYYDKLDNLMDLLNVVFDNNFLVDMFDNIMNALVDDMENGLDVDNVIGSWIYYWVFELNWGRSNRANNNVEVNGDFYPIKFAEQLYDLIVMLNNELHCEEKQKWLAYRHKPEDDDCEH